MSKLNNSKEFTVAVGRRREAVARVRLHKGMGISTINGQPVESYFPGAVAKVKFNKPFVVLGLEGKFWVSVRVKGGGKNGQLEAVVHGISHALAEIDREKNRTPLKKHKLLTRDPRTRERRKVGTGGKARRKKQSPKR
ncbi:30S ribosomal protein S9 [Candidatus Microgenomates bacterium]|nr:30S ribosomal protein S9 [Candidatus Microgenomates bacterium]